MNESKRVRFIVICGDTNSFGSWGTRTGDDQSQFASFMSPFVSLLGEARLKHKCFLNQVADGFVAIFEMKEGHNCKIAIKAIKMAAAIKANTRKIIDKMSHPKPSGFRLRIHCGWGWKWNLGKDKWDYFSPVINTTHKLLRVNKSTHIIVHESIKELISQKQLRKAGIKMAKILNVDNTPPGINGEDLDLLWEVWLQKK